MTDPPINLELGEGLATLDEHDRSRRLFTEYEKPSRQGCPGGPYDWQVDTHQAGINNRLRAIIAGNKCGKTRTFAAECACHATGWYPDWWEGKRWQRPVTICVCGVTNEELRNTLQKELFGDVEADAKGKKNLTGTGWIPRELISSWSFRQCGVPDVIDRVWVRHGDGRRKTLFMMKAYEQGVDKFQAFDSDIMWFDEEPRDPRIFSEALTRLAAMDGIFMLSRTPLYGMSELIRKFVESEPGAGVWWVNVNWDMAPHLNEAVKKDLLAAYPQHERKTRAQGVPMMGTGAVYPVDDESLLVEPRPIPKHWRRICGVDFGFDHPAAGAWLAYDADTDVVYLYDCHKAREQTTGQLALAILARSKWIPVSWPHDGMARDRPDGLPLKDQLLSAGVNVLGLSARYDDEVGGGQGREPATIALLERMQTGRFKVFDTPACHSFLSEKRLLHRKDGRIVDVNDDTESAVRYGVMMIRYAISETEATVPMPSTTPADYDPLASF